jgi:hypothetical protein
MILRIDESVIAEGHLSQHAAANGDGVSSAAIPEPSTLTASTHRLCSPAGAGQCAVMADP